MYNLDGWFLNKQNFPALATRTTWAGFWALGGEEGSHFGHLINSEYKKKKEYLCEDGYLVSEEERHRKFLYGLPACVPERNTMCKNVFKGRQKHHNSIQGRVSLGTPEPKHTAVWTPSPTRMQSSLLQIKRLNCFPHTFPWVIQINQLILGHTIATKCSF